MSSPPPKHLVAVTESVQKPAYFSGKKAVSVRTLLLGQRIDLKALSRNKRLTASPYVLRLGQQGLAVLFRYGVAVLFGLSEKEEAVFIESSAEFILDRFATPEVEEEELLLDPDQSEGFGHDCLSLHSFDEERLQVIADIMAKNAVLAYYETQITQTFDRIEPVAAALQTGAGPSGKQARALLKHIGTTLSIQRRMVGQVQIQEKPELLWDYPEHERLYLRLSDEYELEERYDALKQKLDLIYKTAETLLGVLEDRRILHVEWYIVILILFEIVWLIGERILS